MDILTDTQIADLSLGTLNRLGRLRFNNIAQDLQSHEISGRIMRRDRVMFRDGIGISRTLLTKKSGAAKQTGLYAADNVDVVNVLSTMNVGWKRTSTNYAYERRELIENRGASQIVDIIKSRRAACLIGLAEHLETQGWSAPTSATDVANWFGIPYWFPTDITASGSFDTSNPSFASTGRGGLNHANWGHWVDSYTNVTKGDCLPKMRTAYRKIGFKSPVNIRDFRRGNGDNYRIYVNESVLQDFENIGEAQNETLGKDLASMDGQMVFRKNPVVWVPKLDSDTNNPIYMLNFAFLHFVALNGDFLRESEPDKAADSHNIWVVFVDLSANMICTDLRRNAVLGKTA